MAHLLRPDAGWIVPVTIQQIPLMVDVAATVIGALSLIALVLYVVKTWQIATATARSAAATEAAARATEQSAHLSEAILAEMKEAREAEAAPYVIAYFELDDRNALFFIVAKNIGRSAASDVRLEFEPSLSSTLMAGGNAAPRFLTEPIPYMPPAFQLRSLLWSAVDVFGNSGNVPRSYIARLSYVDSQNGIPHKAEYVLDFSAFENSANVRTRTVDDLYSALSDIGKQQLATAGALKNIAEQLEHGITLANTSLLIDSRTGPTPAADLVRLKLAEVMTLWRTWRARDESDRYRSVDELRTQLRALRNQLQGAAAGVEDEAWCTAASTADRVITTLLGHHFYVDGGDSYRRFDLLAEELRDLEIHLTTPPFTPGGLSPASGNDQIDTTTPADPSD